MSSKHLLRTVAATALLTTGLAAQAGTMTYNGAYHGAYNAVSVVAPGSYRGGSAGGFSVSLSGFSGPDSAFNGSTFEAYCVDVYEYIASSSYSIFSASSYFSDASKVTALGKLISYVYGNDLFNAAGVDKDAQSTALQLAIWNIVYDTDSASSDALTRGTFSENTSGSFRSTTAAYKGADTLLDLSQRATGGPNYELFVLSSGRPISTSAGNQDQLIWRQSTVPEPASLALAGLALGAAAFASRRRRG